MSIAHSGAADALPNAARMLSPAVPQIFPPWREMRLSVTTRKADKVAQRSFLVNSHQAAIASDIGGGISIVFALVAALPFGFPTCPPGRLDRS